MTEKQTAEEWLKQLRRGSRVLLLNPYVQEVRYPWVRWNQPVDLLKLGRLLVDEYDCEVELIDCMLPSSAGRVGNRYVDDFASGERYRTFGVVIDKTQRDLLHQLNQEWSPDFVVMSTLTSYWGPRVISAIRAGVRSAMPQVQVVLSGAFAIHETDRAIRTLVDTVVTTHFPTRDCLPSWDLYASWRRTAPFHEDRKCHFAGLTFHSTGEGSFVRQQISLAKSLGINSFAFFVDDLFLGEGRILRDALYHTSPLGRVDFHGLCGITPSKASSEIWALMLQAGYRSIHLEYDKNENGDLNLDAYWRAASVLGTKLRPGEMSGFVMVGCPGDKLETLVRDTLDILATVGSVIPKPYTPSPVEDRSFYNDTVRHLKGRLDKLGPRAFPLDGRDEVSMSRQDFEDFFGLTTELNQKLHGRPFDLFDDSAISSAFRSSLSKGVWKLAEE